jgi:hypothetical protein
MKQHEEPISSPYLSKIYETRLILMLETMPQSDQYRQVMLTLDQHQQLNALLRLLLLTLKDGSVIMPILEKQIKLDNIQETFTTEQIRKILGGK